MGKLASLDEDGYEIDDGGVAHQDAPASYWIPNQQSRESLQVGDLAKLRFSRVSGHK